ncbi:hypothetical protein BsWGS_02029 [Bradybaena similaris]
MMEIERRTAEVGQILVKVQNDLRQLREQIVTGDGTITVTELDKALSKTEGDLQRHTEDVAYTLHNQMQTIPIDGIPRDEIFWSSESMIEVYKSNNKQPSYVQNRDMLARQPIPPGLGLPRRKLFQWQDLTPGQKQQQLLTLKTIMNPHNERNRRTMKDSFGVQLPLINEKKASKAPEKYLTGSTSEHLTVLPKANRADATLTPPPVEEKDARKGILSLLERGLIPPTAQLTLDPPPVKHRVIQLHDPEGRNRLQQVPEYSSHWALVKLHASEKTEDSLSAPSKMPAVPPRPTDTRETRTLSAKNKRTSSGLKKRAQRIPALVTNSEMMVQPLPPPTTPTSGDCRQTTHKFAIQNGKTRDKQTDFLAFKQQYLHIWGSIVTMLRHLEGLLASYTVPVAFIHGDRLADLSVEFELERRPDVTQLLSVIINRKDVEAIIKKPGQRFLGPNGKEIAATHIQSTWRMYRERLQYLEYRRLKWAAGVIVISWIMRVKMAKMRQQLKQTRLNQLAAFKQRATRLASSWERIKNSRRVIIHIPSLGYHQIIRETIGDFELRQNTQMARLCDIKDPNVDVILISAVSLSDEALQYYSKLLGLYPAVAHGNPEDQCDMTDRYKIIVPEAINSFPTHRMCLSTILKYSPKALQRIKNLIKGREAFIVTGMPHKDDLAVADFLNVPILGPEPDVAHLYSTKSGCKRIFVSAGIDIPPSEYDIYSLDQLYECLAQLVTENLNVQRWLFKLNDEFDGRGIAVCDVPKYLRCYRWALKEEQRYGDKWSKKWAQEAVYVKIHAEIPDILHKYAQPVNTKMFPTWDKFLQAFLSQGGVIEACPPSDSVTTLTTDLLIEPSGTVSLLTCGDQIHADSQFSCWGLSFPQSSIEPSVLNATCQRIANACKSNGIVGYLKIDFVTFIDPKTMLQQLWALGLSLHYSDHLAMFRLLEYVTHGTFQPKTHVFEVALPTKENKSSRQRLLGKESTPNRNRFAVMSTRLMHSNLAVIHYSVFFQTCRAHGIGYDIKDKSGTAFTLIDSFNRERLGMLTVGDDLPAALAIFVRNLSIIHQEISAPNMQGVTNFKDAIADIEGILGTTVQNAEADQDSDVTQ